MGIWYDKEAYQLLIKCSDAKDLTEWNEKRKATNYAPINLRFANLDNFYLQKANLQNVDLRGALSIGSIDFNFANVENAKFFLKNYYFTTFLFCFYMGFMLTSYVKFLDHNHTDFIVDVAGLIINGLYINTIALGAVFLIVLNTKYFSGFFIFLMKIGVLVSVIITSFVVGVLGSGGINYIQKILFGLEELHPHMYIIVGFLSAINIWFSYYAIKYEDERNIRGQKAIAMAVNAEKAIGFNRKYLDDKMKSLVQELQKEASELNKSIELTHDDEEKEKLIYRLEKLEEKIQFYDVQEEKANLQKTQIENVIAELQAPYIYIHKTITKIEWHNRIYYSVIFGFLALFIYSIANGYIDQRVESFTSLFNKDIQPTFGTIFGVILFYGTPVLLGISLIIYFIAQINKNIDKITELQEQERNIKQIASTIKAKAQIGMSDEEFVKETKNLIQKYQEGMMAGMFTKEKISDKEDKSSSSTYREKMIANGMSKLLMQTLKK
jgi:ABC-type multidrug transport system fused ATPase/permease subunit